MSVELNEMPDLQTSTVCRSLYDDFVTSFTDVQDMGVLTDDLMIRIKNMSYNLARPIASVVSDGSGSVDETVLLGYLKTSGGSMSGGLKANYGFEAGSSGMNVLRVFSENERYTGPDGTEQSRVVRGVDIGGVLRLGGSGLLLGGRHVMRYVSGEGLASSLIVDGGERVDFGISRLTTSGSLCVGENDVSGFFVSEDGIRYGNQPVFYGGNCNMETTDWCMKDATVAGHLSVTGAVDLSGVLKAVQGAVLGIDGKEILGIEGDGVKVSGYIRLRGGAGLLFDDTFVIESTGAHVRLSGNKGALLLGGSHTTGVRLWSSVYNENGDRELITKGGGARFPDFFHASFGFGSTLLSTAENCVVVHRELRLGTNKGPFFQVSGNGVSLTSSIAGTGGDVLTDYLLRVNFAASTSLYKPLDRDSRSVVLGSNCDFVVFEKPVESKGYLGIDGSLTKLSDNLLFFSDSCFIQYVPSGLKFTGKAIFKEGIRSDVFSTGFSGSGWAVERDQVNGSSSATFDELTVRKKMRVYEMEVSRINAINGSFWVSDSAAGDRVTEIL